MRVVPTELVRIRCVLFARESVIMCAPGVSRAPYQSIAKVGSSGGARIDDAGFDCHSNSRGGFMKQRIAACVLATLSLPLCAACSKSGVAPSMSFTSPLATQPLNGATFRFSQQPGTLTVCNAVRTGPVVPTYSLEVSTDAGFANKVFTNDGIAQRSGGTTSVQINALAGSTTYYW